jgi:CBS domain-containing protein
MAVERTVSGPYGATIPDLRRSEHRMPTSTSRVVHHLGEHHLDTPVRALMTPGVVTLVEDASLRHAYAALAAHRVHAVLVVSRRDAMPLGWVTARSLLRWLDLDDDLRSARDAISEDVRMIASTATARDAVAALSEDGVTHLLVSSRDSAVPEGVLSDIDLTKVAIR